MDTCTVAALDAITAFAVPNPNCSSQTQSVFSGLVAQRVASPSESLSLLQNGDRSVEANLFDRRKEHNYPSIFGKAEFAGDLPFPEP